MGMNENEETALGSFLTYLYSEKPDPKKMSRKELEHEVDIIRQFWGIIPLEVMKALAYLREPYYVYSRNSGQHIGVLEEVKFGISHLVLRVQEQRPDYQQGIMFTEEHRSTYPINSLSEWGSMRELQQEKLVIETAPEEPDNDKTANEGH